MIQEEVSSPFRPPLRSCLKYLRNENMVYAYEI